MSEEELQNEGEAEEALNNQEEEAEDSEEEGQQLVEIDEDEMEEMDADEFEDDEQEVEEKTEVGAVQVLGQGDFSMCQANRGADDPGDNTLMEPQWVTKFGQMLFITDRGNHRVLIWDQIPEEDGEPASVVLGQEDFADCLENRGVTTTLDEMTSGLGDESLDGFTISMSQDDTLSAPAGVCVIDGKLYVADSGNHRALRWDTIPSDDGEPPDLVMGQDNLETNEANRRGFVGSGSLFFPMGMRSGNDQSVFVADKDNHRILIWDKQPFQNGWNADVCLGQAGMDEREPNHGDYDRCGPDTLSFPTAAFFDDESGKLFVVDQGNNRILIWNKLPRENGVAADLVIGQKDMLSRDVNAGLGAKRSCDSGLYFPTDVVCGRKGLFVSDTGNNRVLMWNEIPTENGQPADLVIGQKTYLECKVNRNAEAAAFTLNDPYGLYLDEDPEDEEDPGKLYICDRGNSRVVVWEDLPSTPKTQELEEDLDYQFEENELMGDDDEFFAENDDEYGMLGEGESEEEEEEDSEEVSST